MSIYDVAACVLIIHKNIDGVLGIDDHFTASFSFYQNPMSDVLYITTKTDIESMSAYNVLGQEVITDKHFAHGKVDVSTLPAGTFVFRLTF